MKSTPNIERTDEEILKRIEYMKAKDYIGFGRNDLISRLSFEAVKPFLKEGITEDQWKPLPKDRESIIEEMKAYMPFAIGKAVNQRGISAERSLCHYWSWTWLIGDEDWDFSDYDSYGINELKAICDRYGFEFSEED